VRQHVAFAAICVLALAVYGCSGGTTPADDGDVDEPVEPADPVDAGPQPDPCEGRPSGEVCDDDRRCSDVGACTCGDGVLDRGEECDDGSSGCDETCHYVCSDSVPCPEAPACRGPSACHPTDHVCEPGEPLPPGEPCPGGFCDDMGNCLGCDREGQECDLANECAAGEIQCTEGEATCVQVGVKATGAPCADGGICDGRGACAVCEDAGGGCDNGEPCIEGVLACEDDAVVCTDGAPVAAGESCGDAQVCDGAGACASCDAEPGEELCDGRDNDCDGAIDESLVAPLCDEQRGVCSGARQRCGGDAGWIPCEASDFPASYEPDETTCDGLDNDCDGAPDEACPCVVGDERECGSDVGECRPGAQSCEVEGWGECVGAVEPAEEVCDGLDNDCSGAPDDDATDAPTWYRDADGDGVGDAGDSLRQCDRPDGFVEVAGDCDDTDPLRYPGLAEVCDGVDNDCNDVVDDGATDAPTWYRDADADRFGDPSATRAACVAPAGYVDNGDDCDDTTAERAPGRAEVCDGLDNDCNLVVDDGATDAATWYRDGDGDGFGDPAVTLEQCGQPAGYVADGTDCDDSTARRRPGLAEVCDGLDNDCNLVVDDGATDAATWYRDGDGDGFGDPAATLEQCGQPAGYVSDGTDCDDAASNRRPGLAEICDGVDNDCNLVVDDGATDAASWYRDGDGDGAGDPGAVLVSCEQPAGYVDNAVDCDDGASNRRPGLAEVCDGVDNDCNLVVDDNATDAPTWYRDSDGDGAGTSSPSIRQCSQPAGYVGNRADCDDRTAQRRPGLPEVCDGIDNDCNLVIDDNAEGAQTWYADGDSDGYGNPVVFLNACERPLGYVDNGDDCDDSRASRHPGLREICDGIDNNCNGQVDEGVPDAPTWYRDADGDTWGNPGNRRVQCARPAGYVNRAGDCDDGTAFRRPGLAEVCDGLDNDCNAGTGESCPRECEVAVFRGRRYLFCDDDSTWDQARSTCESQLMRLARIDDQAENDWMRARATQANGDDDDFWIGANDRGTENRWVWTDGAQFWQGRGNGGPVGGLFSRWNGGEPNDSNGEDCAEVNSSGSWNDNDCGRRIEFTCERY